MRSQVSYWLLACTLLAACDTANLTPNAAPPEPGVAEITRDGPEGAPPGSCWGKTVSPAVIETIREQVQVKPAKVNPDGTLASLPEFRNEARQVIVTPRQDNWFETPCPEVLTAEFNSSLQRALSVRGFYRGPISGDVNRRTRAAIETFQIEQGGPASEVLSLQAARALGLIAVERQNDA